MKKKLAAWLLTFSMVLGLFPVAPLAVQADTPEMAAPILTAGAVYRASATEATVKFVSDAAGTSYYRVTDSATAPAVGDLSEWASGGEIAANTTATLSNIGLISGLECVHIVVKDGLDQISDVLTVEIPSDFYYYENFEIYPLNTAIESGALSPLQQINSGTDSANQKVVAAAGHESAKMLSLSSASSWASDQAVLLDSAKLAASDIYIFEGDVYPLGVDAWQLRFSFTNGNYEGSNEAGIFFKNGNIVSISDAETVLKTGYTANQWYAVKIVAKPLTGKYAVYVNGELLNDDLTLPSGIDRLAISSGHGKTAYFDNQRF